MAQMNRDELEEKIKLTETAIMFAGLIHRRDLEKHLRKLKRELRDYDRFQREAREAG